ncbi:hypothetical protein BD310DRAFT_832399, partial [Dichomitus squalens]
VTREFTLNHSPICLAVVFLHDSMITTREEIRCFWGRRITGAAILFWLNKYMTTLFLVWDLATALNISDKVRTPCDLSTRGDLVVDYLLFTILAVFTSIRVYALRRSLVLCTVTAVLTLVPLGTNMANFKFGVTGENIFPLGCTGVVNMPINIVKSLTIISRTCLIAADGLAIGATWFTLGLPYASRRDGVLKGSISSVLLIDGTMYFFTLAVLDSLHLAFTLLSINVDALQPASVVTAFTTPLSAVLVSRFLLHLQSASLRAVGSTPSSQILSMHIDHSLVFERIVGSLGASISAEDYLKEDYDDDGNVERADELTSRE